MKRSSKRLAVSQETIRQLTTGDMRRVDGGVITGPTNSGDAHCPTTVGYPSCASCTDCTSGGGDTYRTCPVELPPTR